MGHWLAKSPLASALRTFAAVLLAALIADWTSAGSLAFDRWQTWIIAALSSAVPVVIRALNPSDTAFGRGSLRSTMAAQEVAADALVQATPDVGVGSTADPADPAVAGAAVAGAGAAVAAPAAPLPAAPPPVMTASPPAAPPVVAPAPPATVAVAADQAPPSRKPRRSLVSMSLLALGNLLMLGGLGALMAYWNATSAQAWREIAPDMVAPLVVVILIGLSQTAQRLRFILQSAAVVVSLYMAGPTVILWMAYLRTAGDSPEDPLVITSILLTFIGALVCIAAVITLVVQLRGPLLAPANRASFQVDTTSLITLLAAAAVIFVNGTITSLGSYVLITDPQALSSLLPGGINRITIMLAWVIPVILWTAFTVRRGGAIALGSAIGLVSAFAVFPLALPIIGRILGSSDPQEFSSTWTPAGSNALLAILAALLLVIVLVWNSSLNQHSPPPAARPSADAPINTLSVVAFCLAWLPVTSLVAIVLGHIAYDQIVGNPSQRGIGLARWSIALGYAVPALILLYFFAR